MQQNNLPVEERGFTRSQYVREIMNFNKIHCFEVQYMRPKNFSVIRFHNDKSDIVVNIFHN
jgi:hypothetical protein